MAVATAAEEAAAAGEETLRLGDIGTVTGEEAVATAAISPDARRTLATAASSGGDIP